MPRSPRIHPDALLLTIGEVAVMLRVDADKVRALVADGYLKSHPILARISRREVEKFALEYGDDAETNEEERRPLGTKAAKTPGPAPKIGVWANSR